MDLYIDARTSKGCYCGTRTLKKFLFTNVETYELVVYDEYGNGYEIRIASPDVKVNLRFNFLIGMEGGNGSITVQVSDDVKPDKTKYLDFNLWNYEVSD